MRTASVTITRVFGALAVSGAIGLGVSLAAPAPQMSPQQRVDAAWKAMGGDKLAALKTIRAEYTVGQWDPGASYTLADNEKPDQGQSKLVQTRDLSKGLARNEWDRPLAGGGRRVYTEIVTPNAGYSIGNDAVPGRLPKRTIQGAGGTPEHTMSGRRLTASLRELARLTVIQDMKANPGRVTAMPNQVGGIRAWPALQYAAPTGNFIVLFDPATNLPVRVRSLDWDALEGDSEFDAFFGDWRDVNGAKWPGLVRTELNGMKVHEFKATNITANPTVAANAFTIPQAQLANAARPADARITPFQWIIRRSANGFYYDADAMYVDDGDQMKMVDIARDVALAQGNTHNTVFIATNTYLIAIEAPNDDGQAKEAIRLAKQRFPGKPIRYLVLTHHHVDHVGGMRTFAAEGATLVFARGTAPNVQYYRRQIAHTQDLNWNKPAMPNHEPELIEVEGGKWTVNDGGREFSVFEIANPHSDGMLIGWLPDVRLAFNTDLWVTTPEPVRASNANLAALVAGVEKAGIQPENFSGGHGTIANYAQMAQVVKAAQGAAGKAK
jgi:glyoxylase-like metal-dependent hydrolase (beta-lactamase superfamily II)